MTSLQARLLAARSVQAAQEQERFARELRPSGDIPAQRGPQRAAQDTAPTLSVISAAV